MSVFGGPDIVTDGLVLHLDAANRKSYPLSGSTIYDLSGNGNDGAFGGSTAAPTFNGDNGGCISFDGSNDYISVPYASILAPTSQISYGVYAYSSNWNDITSSIRIMSKTENGGYQIAMNEPVYLGNGYVGGLIYVAGTYRAARILKSSLSSGWHYMQFTFDGRYYRMYLDGINVNTYDHVSTASISYAYNNHLAIGAEPDGTTGVTGAYFPGKIAQLTINNRALSANEVQQNYNALKGRFGL
jgi:hypothetical protein